MYKNSRKQGTREVPCQPDKGEEGKNSAGRPLAQEIAFIPFKKEKMSVENQQDAVKRVADALTSFIEAGGEGNSSDLAAKLTQLYILISTQVLANS